MSIQFPALHQGRMPRRLRTQARSLTGIMLVAPATILAIALFFVPLILMVWMSLNNWPILGAHRFAGATNYRAAFHDPQFRHSLLFSLEFTVIVAVGLLVIGGVLAAVVAVRRRGVGVFRTVYFLPVVIGMASASYLWLWMLNPSVGLLDRMFLDLHIGRTPIQWLGSTGLAVTAVSVMTLWKLAGFSMLILMSGIQSVPEDILDASMIDGASRLRQWLRIKIPLMRTHIALVLVFGVAGGFLAFDQFYIMTHGSPGTSTLTSVFDIYNTSFVNFNLGYGAALSVIVMVVLLIFSVIQLLIVRGSSEY
jgi:multiple sugar transport system permease protein